MITLRRDPKILGNKKSARRQRSKEHSKSLGTKTATPAKVAQAASDGSGISYPRWNRPSVRTAFSAPEGVRRRSDPELSATRVLILTTFETEDYVAQALRAGAGGFLGKDVTADTLLTGLRTVASSEALLPPVTTRSLITRFLMTPASGAGGLAPPERLAGLTVREREVMAPAAEGRSSTEIAEDLTLSPLTVRTHIHRAMTKLHARDRARLVVIAYRTGQVRAAPPAT
jgi:DNA-binding NarL/FixJ family response regulator